MSKRVFSVFFFFFAPLQLYLLPRDDNLHFSFFTMATEKRKIYNHDGKIVGYYNNIQLLQQLYISRCIKNILQIILVLSAY